MGNGDALADAGGAEFFPGHQRFEYFLFVEAATTGRGQLGNLIEQPFFATHRNVVIGAVFAEKFSYSHS